MSLSNTALAWHVQDPRFDFSTSPSSEGEMSYIQQGWDLRLDEETVLQGHQEAKAEMISYL